MLYLTMKTGFSHIHTRLCTSRKDAIDKFILDLPNNMPMRSKRAHATLLEYSNYLHTDDVFATITTGS